MNYSYQALSNVGQPTSGILAAPSLVELRRQLKEKGLYLVKADPISAAVPISRIGRSSSGKISQHDLLNLTSQFAIMAQAGVDIASALQMIASECAQPKIRQTLLRVHERVAAGESMSEALRGQSRAFGEVYVASIAAGEASGRIAPVLARLAQLLRADIKLASTVRGLLAYPIVLLTVSLSVLVALTFFVLPTFADVFDNMGIPLPGITLVLLAVSHFLTSNALIVVTVLAAAVGSTLAFARTDRGRLVIDQSVLKIPILSNITRYLVVGRLFRLMGTMLESGVPLLETLTLCQNSVRNKVYRDLFQEIKIDVTNGRGISGAISRSPWMPPAAAQMIATGERSGNLANVAQLLGEHYENEAETRFKDFATILEPALVIGVGSIVATVVLSLVLPMFDFAAAAEGR
jgi:type II secretory pathway component PulF